MKNFFSIALVVLFFSCADVFAATGENTLSFSPTFYHLYGKGAANHIGAQLKYRRGIDDFYNFFLSGTFVQPVERNAQKVFSLSLGFTYFIDAVSWVPEILFGLGLYSLEERFEYPGIFAGLALDYRRWKTFSIGMETCYHFLFQKQPGYSYPQILSVALRFGYYF